MLRELVFKNIGWKILSLALAIAIWLTIKTLSTEQGHTEKMFIGLSPQIVSSTTDVRAFKIDPAVIRVTLRGRSDTINALSEADIHALVDITSADLNQVFRKHVDVAVPNGITVVTVDPSEVQVTPSPQPKILIKP